MFGIVDGVKVILQVLHYSLKTRKFNMQCTDDVNNLFTL